MALSNSPSGQPVTCRCPPGALRPAPPDAGLLAGTPTVSSVIGRIYLERGRPVIVVIQWGPGGGPRNVLIRRDDGQLVVRPFRGLRKPAVGAANDDNPGQA